MPFPGRIFFLVFPLVSTLEFSRLNSGKNKEGKEVSRPYTPISKADKRGSLELIIKVYFPNERFPDGGAVTQYLHSREEGAMVKIAGPKGKIEYLKHGRFHFTLENRKKTYRKISCIGGGSGLTPLYQVISHLLEEKEHKFEISFLFANKSQKDILMKKELDELRDSGAIKLAYAIDKEEEGWNGFTGFVNAKMLEKFLPEPYRDHLVLICGPPLMTKDVLKGLTELGHHKENVFKF